MNKYIYIVALLIICLLFNFQSGWLLFVAMFLMLSFPHIPSSILWQIPMGCLIADIAILFCNNDTALLFRGLFFSATVIFAFVKPRKLTLLLPAAILLFLFRVPDNYGVFAMTAAVASGAFSAFNPHRKIFSRKFS